jgi:hypothetical protein
MMMTTTTTDLTDGEGEVADGGQIETGAEVDCPTFNE